MEDEYCKQSETGGSEGLEMRLVPKILKQLSSLSKAAETVEANMFIQYMYMCIIV